MCLTRESNPWPFGLWNGVQPTEPHQSGLTGLFFLLLNCKISLYILHTILLSDIWFADIVSCYLCIFFIMSFETHLVFFKFWGLIYVPVVTYIFGAISKNHCLFQGHKDLHLFSSESFIALGLTFPSTVHGMMCKVGVQLGTFTCGEPVAPAPFLAKTILSPLHSLDTLVEK